jgi:hypothetical protein
MGGDGDWGNAVLSNIGHGQDVMDGHFWGNARFLRKWKYAN